MTKISEHQPPRLARKILKLYCGVLRFEEIDGDLEELFCADLENHSPAKAKIKYVINTIRCFKPYAWKRTNYRKSSNMDLYFNYLTTSWRRLKKEKGYSAISLIALSIGLTSFILISTYIINEYSFEAFYKKSDMTYRVVQIDKDGHGVEHVAMAAVPLAKAIKEEVPAATNVVTVWRGSDGWIRNDEKEFYESKYLLATENFFDIFEQEFLYGNSESALRSPLSAVVTESFAERFFGREMVVGEVLDLDRYGQFTITAVVKDLPQNTHLPYDLVLSPYFDHYFTQVNPFFRRYFDSWYGHPCAIYISPDNQNEIGDIEAGLTAILAKNAEVERPQNTHYLQKVSDIHFAEDDVYSGVSRIPQGDKTKILTLSVIAILLLFTSLVNYINLFSARISRRLKEIGVRKCLGAAKSHVIMQVMTETTIVISIATLLAIGLSYYLLPIFNYMIGKDLVLSADLLGKLLLILIPVMIFASVLSALYPSYLEIKHSKGITELFKVKSSYKSGFRNVLTGLQFFVATLMIICTIIIFKQIAFVTNQDLGYEDQNILIMEVNGGGVRNNYAALRAELLTNPNISEVAGMSLALSGYRESMDVNYLSSQSSDTESEAAGFYGFDENAISLLEIPILAGSDFSGLPVDSLSIIINESMARMEFPDLSYDEIIGEELRFIDWDNMNLRIIAVAQNFHFESLHQNINPLIIGHLTNPISDIDDIAIKIEGNDFGEAIAHIDQLHKKYEPSALMSLQFQDDMVESAYKEDLIYRRVFTTGAILTILVALIGIVGLTSYTSELRSKEFGIRKVFGASIYQILTLQFISIVRLLLVAEVLAIPLIWIWANRWLSNFAYSVTVSPWIYMLGGLILIIVSGITVNLISYKIASLKPALTLKDE